MSISRRRILQALEYRDWRIGCLGDTGLTGGGTSSAPNRCCGA